MSNGYQVRASVRRGSVLPTIGSETFETGNVDAATNWRAALAGCQVVVHLAARVHIICEKQPDPLAAFRSGISWRKHLRHTQLSPRGCICENQAVRLRQHHQGKRRGSRHTLYRNISALA